MDLRFVISRILAGSVVFGAGVACKCPPTAPDALVEGSEPLSALAGEVAEERESDHCEAVCDTLDDLVDGWRCSFAPVMQPTTAECLRPGATEPEPLDLIANGLGVPELFLPQADCEAICMTTEGWTVAEQAGVASSAIWCADLAGDTLEELTMTCRFGSECIGGRRPLAACGVADAVEDAGSWWATMAALEHVSIAAFEELARDLALNGAPQSLVRRALAAADVQ